MEASSVRVLQYVKSMLKRGRICAESDWECSLGMGNRFRASKTMDFEGNISCAGGRILNFFLMPSAGIRGKPLTGHRYATGQLADTVR